jgi:hypothetical protein
MGLTATLARDPEFKRSVSGKALRDGDIDDEESKSRETRSD